MEWTQDHDLMLLRETAFEDPFQFKKGSPDRGEVWSKIARSLNSSAELKFAVKQRSVRERFALLQAKYKEKNKKDEASSGTSTQMSELDRLLEDITEKEKDSEESRNAAAAKKDNQDREKAESIRKTAMERVSQTKKRQEGTEREAVSTKRRRRGGDETIEYLREKKRGRKKGTRARTGTEKGRGGTTGKAGRARPDPDAGDVESNATTATAESKHDSFANAATTTFYECNAKSS